ncbi:MAG: hypothetical protein U9N57_03415 [Pseudomonadota bacterium]|nr:hypothetical protein [Pseudomonadota bacterium]
MEKRYRDTRLLLRGSDNGTVIGRLASRPYRRVADNQHIVLDHITKSIDAHAELTQDSSIYDVTGMNGIEGHDVLNKTKIRELSKPVVDFDETPDYEDFEHLKRKNEDDYQRDIRELDNDLEGDIK